MLSSRVHVRPSRSVTIRHGKFSRHPALGMDFQPYQALWRLAGVDHMHVHGLAGKFSQADAEVVRSAHDCLTPLADPKDVMDVVMPAFSSGQWAGTMPATIAAVPSGDLMFMCGGGILAHPGDPAAGVASPRQAWHGINAGQRLEAAAHESPELRDALAFFGPKHWAALVSGLRHIWYGDDFTGASDTLATLAGAGLRTMLFLGIPLPRHLEAAGPLDALGIARAARAMSPSAMEAELEPVSRFLASLRAPVLHYKSNAVPRSTAHLSWAASVLQCASSNVVCATTLCPWSVAGRASGATAR